MFHEEQLLNYGIPRSKQYSTLFGKVFLRQGRNIVVYIVLFEINSQHHMPTIHTFHILPKEFEGKVTLLKEVCFRKNSLSVEKRIEHDDRFCSQPSRTAYIMAVQYDTVIGLAIALKRPVLFQQANILLGGIGGVCTEPSNRRKGIATSVLRVAMKELSKAGCDVAFLCTDIDSLRDLYGGVGFVPLRRTYTYLGKSGKRYYEDNGMVAPVKNKEVFEKIMSAAYPFDIGTGNW